MAADTRREKRRPRAMCIYFSEHEDGSSKGETWILIAWRRPGLGMCKLLYLLEEDHTKEMAYSYVSDIATRYMRLLIKTAASIYHSPQA